MSRERSCAIRFDESPLNNGRIAPSATGTHLKVSEFRRAEERKESYSMKIADTFMIFMILNGFALSCAYLLAQLVDCRTRHTADAKDKAAIRLLYQGKSSDPQESAGVRAVVDLADVNIVAGSNSRSLQGTF
jgi:hypothetical protein